MKRTLYEVLGVDHEAPAEEIAAAYQKRVAALQAAPSQDSSEHALLRDARDILSDPYLRAAYDTSLEPPAAPLFSEQHAEPEQAPASWLRQRRWPIAAALLLLICIVWFTVSRTSPRVHKVPAQAITSQAAPAPAEEESPAADAAAWSPKDVFNEVSASIVRVNVMDGEGRLIDSVSGIVIEPGTVITNCHVAVRGTTLAVKGRSEPRPAMVQMADEQLNLCRLSVPGLDAPPATLGSVWSLHQGQRVLAVGASLSGEASMREGTVSALAQVDHGTVIHTTAPISAAWSGGGLFDFAGHLVGIATYHHSYGQNINVALPIDWIAQMHARAVDTNGPQAGALADNQDISQNLITGRWVCFGSIPGRNGDYTFRDDGRVLVTSSQGTPIDARYSVSKRALQFGTAAQRTTFNIESFSNAQMIWQLGGAESRVVCDRR